MYTIKFIVLIFINTLLITSTCLASKICEDTRQNAHKALHNKFEQMRNMIAQGNDLKTNLAKIAKEHSSALENRVLKKTDGLELLKSNFLLKLDRRSSLFKLVNNSPSDEILLYLKNKDLKLLISMGLKDQKFKIEISQLTLKKYALLYADFRRQKRYKEFDPKYVKKESETYIP